MKALRAIVAAGVLLVAGPAFGMTGQCQCSMSVVSGAAGMTLTSGQARGPCGREMSLSKALAAGSAQTTVKAVGAFAADSVVAAATKSVSVTDFQFSPTPVSITVGDTVTWSFNGGFHNVKSVVGSAEAFTSPDLFSGTYSHTFTKAGTFTYYCSFHGSDNGNGTANGMVGRITVTAAPEPVGLALLPVAAGLMWRRRR